MKKKGFLEGYKTYDTSQGYGNPKEWREAFRERMSKEEATIILQKADESPYSVLQVSENATTEEIKKAYRKKLMEWHPDRNQHRISEAEEMTKKIIAAYVTLTA